MAKSLEFGRSVLVMDADDSRLEAALKADEQLVRQSVGKMQGNLNKLEVSMGGTGGGAVAASAGVSALGAAAAATGNSAAQGAAQLGTLGVALSMTATAAAAAKVQLLGAASAALAFATTPIGLITVALGAAVAATTAVIMKGRAERAEAEDWLQTKVQMLEDVRAATGKQVKALEQQIAVEQGLAKTTDHIGNERIRLLTEELIGIKARNAAEAAGVKLQEQRASKLGGLQDQLDILQGHKTAYDLIADAEERALRIQIDQTREMQTQAKLAEGRARAERERFEGKGPRTAGEAETLVRGSLQLAEANQRSGALVRDAVNALKAMGMDAKMLEKVAQSLGVGVSGAAAKPVTSFGRGAIELSAFASSGRGGGGAGFDPVQAARISKEDRRTKDLENIRKSSERTAAAIEQWHPGAN